MFKSHTIAVKHKHENQLIELQTPAFFRWPGPNSSASHGGQWAQKNELTSAFQEFMRAAALPAEAVIGETGMSFHLETSWSWVATTFEFGDSRCSYKPVTRRHGHG